MQTLATVLFVGLVHLVLVARQPPPFPVVDMHLHAVPVDSQGPPPLAICAPFQDIPMRDARDVWSPSSDAELMAQTLEVLERRNIIGVTSGPLELVRAWRLAAPDRVIPGLSFQLGPRAAIAGCSGR